MDDYNLKFTPFAWSKFLFMRDLGPTEIGAFGLCQIPGEPLVVTDLFIPKQTVSSVTVDFDDDSVSDFMEDQLLNGMKWGYFDRIWLHTHPGSSADPSTTDETTFASAFSKQQWAVMGILARGGATTCAFKLNQAEATPEMRVDLSTSVTYRFPFRAWSEEDKVECRRIYDERVLRERELISVGYGGAWPPSSYWNQKYSDAVRQPYAYYENQSGSNSSTDRFGAKDDWWDAYAGLPASQTAAEKERREAAERSTQAVDRDLRSGVDKNDSGEYDPFKQRERRQELFRARQEIRNMSKAQNFAECIRIALRARMTISEFRLSLTPMMGKRARRSCVDAYRAALAARSDIRELDDDDIEYAAAMAEYSGYSDVAGWSTDAPTAAQGESDTRFWWAGDRDDDILLKDDGGPDAGFLPTAGAATSGTEPPSEENPLSLAFRRWTPELAVAASSWSWEDFHREMLDAGKDPLAKDCWSWSPVQCHLYKLLCDRMPDADPRHLRGSASYAAAIVKSRDVFIPGTT